LKWREGEQGGKDIVLEGVFLKKIITYGYIIP
jgi:hypothetical protein